MESVPTHKKFAIIQDMVGCYGSIQLLCEIAGVSRSGYYKWVKRQERPSQKQLEDEQLKEKIKECHEEGKGIYGYRRVKVWLKRKHKLDINHTRVQRLMREMGIRAVIRKKRPYYGKKEPYVISDNHLNRDFHASKPNEKWVTDITYLIFMGKSSICPLLKTYTIMKFYSPRNGQDDAIFFI
ncbi:IS3 family transposase [Parageobacillus thermoglucosidasius]|uniref:IS3 family transposase n=1 Tax=Parageobacillus thermoglucosidasius TaxID=1426 RepID=A0AB38QX53_PARTM|nr:IS3 family transposase [Parageobacillus thermoglucosidasius]UOE75676.1 IS3 family transposase [Parageobacillus thermoglucosidasius]